ncbi:putative syntaxin [Cyclospora cayetanensis]|uniref:Syntaxin n=1 Tax=Cyclospora cayetanensis TaxID=88456 RepID=A0A1D3D734_9EIME|nr:putative syntaxin [Cyclospora cayetanensis]
MRDRFEELRTLAVQLHPEAAALMHRGEAAGSASAAGGGGRGRGGSPLLAGDAHALLSADLEAGRHPDRLLANFAVEEAKGPPDEEAFLSGYFRKVAVLTAALAEIGENVEKMQELKRRVVEATNSEEEKDVSHELHKVLDGTTLLMQKTQRALETLRTENRRFAEAQRGSLSSVSELRIRHNLQQTLAAQLQQHLQLLQMRQAEYRLQVKKKVLRQIKLGMLYSFSLTSLHTD